MNKLKHEDVMMALEWCSCYDGNCPTDCPLFTDTECYQTLSKNVLYLLREKDAEIERLTAYNANLLCANTDITNRHKDYVEEAERIARRDAITEFEERLIKYYDALKSGLVAYHIREVAKELKEASNA